MEIFNCDQNTPEWFQARLGIPTASSFSAILAKGEGKTRRTYMMKLAGEILTGEPTESYSNDHTERGHKMEADAIDFYVQKTGAELTPVGFIRDGRKGCSPDALVGENGGVEIKTKLPHILAEILLKGEVPTEHKAQVQGQLWVAQRYWWDVCVYWPRMPLFIKRVYRDEPYITKLSEAVDQFNEELDKVVEDLRSK